MGERPGIYDNVVGSDPNAVKDNTTTATTPTPVVTTPTPTVTTTATPTVSTSTSPVTNVADYGASLATNPSLLINGGLKVGEYANGTPAAQVDPNVGNLTTPVAPVVTTTVSHVAPTQTGTYETQKTAADVAAQNMTAAQGTVGANSTYTAPQEDVKAIATGKNADGSTNYVGEALQKSAVQNMSNIIDTTTSSGKLLAESLGEGNYLDAKATMRGQLETLQNEFIDSTTGEPKIPIWAQGTARNVSKIFAFSGMSGTAATAAMSTALMEASLPIAQSESAFFQSLTLKNLDNKQQSTINAANVIAKFESQNLDNRMQAAKDAASSSSSQFGYICISAETGESLRFVK